MKHLSGLWHKLTVVVAVTAALSSCNRAEYAMLPKTTSYHGTEYHAVAPAAPTATTPEVASVTETLPGAETAAPAPVAVAKVPQKREAAPAVAAAPKKAVAAPKTPNLLENAMIKKVTKRAEKIADKILVKQKKEIAGTSDANAITGYLRTGIILLLVGLLITIIPGDIFKIIGGILTIVGVIFIVLWLLDNL